MQKAKRRPTVTKIVYVPTYPQNGNGSHTGRTWVPGDPVELNPLYSTMGAFKDDPTWDAFIQIMKDERQKELERDLRCLDEAEQEKAEQEAK